MEKLISLTCPNCGASTTNHKNCEYCNSLLVRFVDKGIEINESRYGRDASIFPGLAELLKIFARKINDSNDGGWVNLAISNGFGGKEYITVLSVNGSEMRIQVSFPQKSSYLEQLKNTDFFPLFTPYEIESSKDLKKSIDNLTYYIDYGADYEGATKIITQILIQVIGVDVDIAVLDYHLEGEINESEFDEYYRGGKTEPFRRISQPTAIYNSNSEETEKEESKTGFGRIIGPIILIALFILLLKTCIG